MNSPPAGFTSPLFGPLQLGAIIGRGKEGATYRITGVPHLVAKIYHSPPSSKTIKKLEVMISSPPSAPSTGSQRPVLAWPQALVHDKSGSVSGFVMPLVEPTWSINRLFFPEQRAKLRTAANTQIGWHNLHEIARNLALIVSSCHKSGYVVGDLNNHNVRVYPDGQVCLIDTDSFQVVDASQHPPAVHHCEVVFPDYTPPELLGRNLSTFDRTPASDSYAISILVFMLLQDGMHPFAAHTDTDPPLDPSKVMQARGFPYLVNRNNRSIRAYTDAPSFGRLHPRLRDLFVQTFTTGLDEPLHRPSANDWQQSLGVARASLQMRTGTLLRWPAGFQMPTSGCGKWRRLLWFNRTFTIAKPAPFSEYRHYLREVGYKRDEHIWLGPSHRSFCSSTLLPSATTLPAFATIATGTYEQETKRYQDQGVCVGRQHSLAALLSNLAKTQR